jgi:hypothetical protein
MKYASNPIRSDNTGNKFPGLADIRFSVLSRHSITGRIINVVIEADIPQELCLFVFNILVRHIRAQIEAEMLCCHMCPKEYCLGMEKMSNWWHNHGLFECNINIPQCDSW